MVTNLKKTIFSFFHKQIGILRTRKTKFVGSLERRNNFYKRRKRKRGERKNIERKCTNWSGGWLRYGHIEWGARAPGEAFVRWQANVIDDDSPWALHQHAIVLDSIHIQQPFPLPRPSRGYIEIASLYRSLITRYVQFTLLLFEKIPSPRPPRLIPPLSKKLPNAFPLFYISTMFLNTFFFQISVCWNIPYIIRKLRWSYVVWSIEKFLDQTFCYFIYQI